MAEDRPPPGLSWEATREWYRVKKQLKDQAFDRRLAAGEIRFDPKSRQIVENKSPKPTAQPTPAGAANTVARPPEQMPADTTTSVSAEPSCPEIQMTEEDSSFEKPNEAKKDSHMAIEYSKKISGKPQSDDASRASSAAMETGSDRESSPDVPLASFTRSRQSSAYSAPTFKATSRETSASVEQTKSKDLPPQRKPIHNTANKDSNSATTTAKKRPSISQLQSVKLPKIPKMTPSGSASSALGGATGAPLAPMAPAGAHSPDQSDTSANATNPSGIPQAPAQAFSERLGKESPEWIQRRLLKRERSSINRDKAVAFMHIRDDIKTAEKNGDHATAHEETLNSIRERLHQLEHFEGIDELLMIDSRLLTEEYGLPRLFLRRHDGFRFPYDIVLDSKALFKKWARQDFDPNIMRGMVTKKTRNEAGKLTKSTSVSKDYGHRAQSGTFGAGDLVSGQWWPVLLAALRDGAHGEAQAGISGVKGRGATSVIVSGSHYDDKDEGDIVYYCGTEPQNGEQGMTADTKLLYENVSTGEPVRLLRSSKLNNLYSPTLGFRFDGLYDVIRGDPIPGKTDCRRFELRRRGNQDPIRYQGIGKRPTPDDIQAYRKHKDLSG